MSHRKPATETLFRGLSEVVLEFGNVGHRDASSVDHPDAMTKPVGTSGSRRAELGGDHFDQGLQNAKGQSHSSFAVGRGAESPLSKLDNMLTSGIAVEDLEQEKRDRGDGIELAISPRITGLTTGFVDGFRRENFTDVLTQSRKDRNDMKVHGRAPSRSR